MDQYIVRPATWTEGGREERGWEIVDPVAAAPAIATIVGRIYGGDSGDVFRRALIAAGATQG
jgi:hypothetical protein